MKFLISIVGLSLLLGSSFAIADLFKSQELNQQDVQRLFPPELKDEILNELSLIPWTEKQLAQYDSLTFMSAQSTDTKNQHLINKVYFFGKSHYDIWLMKQKINPNPDPATWNRVVIAVNREKNQAYYFEMGPEGPGEVGRPHFKAFTAPCLSCHSSGPRVIRPMKSELTNPFLTRDIQLLKTWNQRIENGRETTNYRPMIKEKSILDLHEPGSLESLKIPLCVSCHANGSGIRGPLQRQNLESILFLTHNHLDRDNIYISADRSESALAEMPLQSTKLNSQQQICLETWLNHKQDLEQQGCSDVGTPTIEKSFHWSLNPRQSQLDVLVSTKVSQFKVSGALVNGKMNCKDSVLKSCEGRATFNFEFVSSGIELRDQHLSQILDKYGFKSSTVEFELNTLNQWTLNIKWGTRIQKVKLDNPCRTDADHSSCQFDVPLNLTDFDFPVPEFLGLKVDNQITVRGHFEAEKVD